MKKPIYSILTIMLLTTSSAMAAVRDDLEDCTRYVSKYAKQSPSSKPGRELYVLIDQTVVPDQRLKKELLKKVARYIKPGDKINVVSFSAYSSGHYTELKFSGVRDRPLPKEARNNIPPRYARKFDKCMKKQRTVGLRRLAKSINTAFTGPGDNYDFTNTELIGAINTLSVDLIGKSDIKAKTLLIFSDMIENSSMISFFRKKQVRVLKPDDEIKKVKRAGMIPNLQGAKVYVIGAGWMANGALYQSSHIMKRMRAFWEKFFALSKASLEGFGEPLLMTDIN